jgi:hypothetical protein
MPDPPMLPTTCSANRSSLTEGAVHTNALQVDLMPVLQPLCQPAPERLQLSETWTLEPGRIVTTLELPQAKALCDASDWCTLLPMTLYKSACTAQFHSSLELKPVSGSDQLFLSALSCRRHIHQTQWNQPKGFGPSTESPADARLFSLLRHAFHETLTSLGADWKHKRI